MNMAISCFLSAMLIGYIIFPILIHPALATSESVADYMYDLDEDGIGGEDGIDFGSPFEPLTFTSYIHHNQDNKITSDKTSLVGDPLNPKSATASVDKSKSEIGSGESSIKNLSLIGNDQQDKFQSKLSRTGDHLFGSLLIAFCFISLVGNSCILIIFCFRHRKLSPAEVFLVNLGIVDILLSLASYPMSMVASFKHRWDFGEIGCTAYAFISYFLGVTSIFSIVAIALIRYLKTCSSAQGNQITCWTACKMIFGSYVVALIWAAMPLVGFGNYNVEPFGLSCTLDWVAKDTASRVYIILVTIFCVFLPLLIILFCYSQIILLVRQSDALMRNSGVNKNNMKGSDLQLTWISGLVTIGFIIAWCPYSVACLWASFRGEMVLPMWATPIPVLMAKSSIAYNPFIYTFFTARYREDFASLIERWVCSHAKGSTRLNNNINNNNNNGTSLRASFKRSTRPANMNGTGNDSPDSGSSSLVTRQLTSTSSQYILTGNGALPAFVNDGGSSAGFIPLQTLGTTHTINNINFNDIHSDSENEGDEYLSEVDELNEDEDEDDDDDVDDHNAPHETRILIVQEQNRYHQSNHNITPSQVITMFTGNGTVSTRSATRKLMSAFTA